MILSELARRLDILWVDSLEWGLRSHNSSANSFLSDISIELNFLELAHKTYLLLLSQHLKSRSVVNGLIYDFSVIDILSCIAEAV